jgi:hypothetical protein
MSQNLARTQVSVTWCVIGVCRMLLQSGRCCSRPAAGDYICVEVPAVMYASHFQQHNRVRVGIKWAQIDDLPEYHADWSAHSTDGSLRVRYTHGCGRSGRAEQWAPVAQHGNATTGQHHIRAHRTLLVGCRANLM